MRCHLVAQRSDSLRDQFDGVTEFGVRFAGRLAEGAAVLRVDAQPPADVSARFGAHQGDPLQASLPHAAGRRHRAVQTLVSVTSRLALRFFRLSPFPSVGGLFRGRPTVRTFCVSPRCDVGEFGFPNAFRLDRTRRRPRTPPTPSPRTTPPVNLTK